MCECVCEGGCVSVRIARMHGSKRGLREESPMEGDELTSRAGTKNQTFKEKYCESDIV